MAAVSSLYRMAPSDWAGGEDERRLRMKQALSRLCATYGHDHVEHRIRAYEPTNEDERILRDVLLAEVG